jgi:hypothetical protein
MPQYFGNEIKKDEKGGACSTWKIRNAHRILVRKPEKYITSEIWAEKGAQC